jgi:hypothetical protein
MSTGWIPTLTPRELKKQKRKRENYRKTVLKRLRKERLSK